MKRQHLSICPVGARNGNSNQTIGGNHATGRNQVFYRTGFFGVAV